MQTQPDPDQILVIPPAHDAPEEPFVTQATILEDVFEPLTAAPAASQEKGLSLFSQELAPATPDVILAPQEIQLFSRELAPISYEPAASAQESVWPSGEVVPATLEKELSAPLASPPKLGPAAREWGRRSVPPQRGVTNGKPAASEKTFDAAPENPPAPRQKVPVPQERTPLLQEKTAAPRERPPAVRERPRGSQENMHVSQEKALASQEKATQQARAAKGGDRYSFGVQMMRVSPAWLLVGGLAFVSLIVLCTWLVKPGQTDEQLLAQAPVRNQATNPRPADAPKAPGAADKQATAKPAEQKPAAESKPAETKPVESKAAETKPAESKAEAAVVAARFKEDGKFTVQVGSFPEQALAQERVNRLKAAGFDGRVVVAQIPNRGTWYRVQAGRFGDRAEAGRYGSEMRTKGVADGAIVTEIQ